MRLLALSCLTLFVEACASADGATTAGALSHGDGPSLDASNALRERAETGIDSGDASDGSAACEAREDSPPDFSIRVSGEGQYEGAATLASSDGGAMTLVAIGDGGTLEASLGGASPSVPQGETLWTELSRQKIPGNPFSMSRFRTTSTLRTRESGPILADAVTDFVPVSRSITFLGVPTSASLWCSRREINNIVTNASCMTTRQYSITIHGDSDISLTPASHGRVMVSGIEYEVWLTSARVEAETTSSSCIPDWEPPLGLSLSARAVRYEDVWNATP